MRVLLRLLAPQVFDAFSGVWKMCWGPEKQSWVHLKKKVKNKKSWQLAGSKKWGRARRTPKPSRTWNWKCFSIHEPSFGKINRRLAMSSQPAELNGFTPLVFCWRVLREESWFLIEKKTFGNKVKHASHVSSRNTACRVRSITWNSMVQSQICSIFPSVWRILHETQLQKTETVFYFLSERRALWIYFGITGTNFECCFSFTKKKKKAIPFFWVKDCTV